MHVAVVTDSASNLPAELVERHSIEIVPMILKFGDRALLDGVDMPVGEFYRALVDERVPVSTSAPSPGDFREAFERCLARADAVVCVTVASFVSATYESAITGARDFGHRVRVVDSRSASLGEGLPALEAARAAQEGRDVDGVVARANDIAARTNFVATIETFEFLRRSGRVNAVLAHVGTALNIKPVFAFRDGALHQVGRPRTRARALDRLVEEVRTAGASGPLHLGIAHADREEEAIRLLETLQEEVPHVETLISGFTPVMGAHTGPGVIGVGFWRD